MNEIHELFKDQNSNQIPLMYQLYNQLKANESRLLELNPEKFNTDEIPF
jgi:hypothetical protein